MSNFFIRVLTISIALTSVIPAFCQERKLAVVVGVNAYRANSGLPTLQHAGGDAAALSGTLRDSGFTVYEMTHDEARKGGQETMSPQLDYIRDQIKGILESPNLGENDAILITLHGHGVQYDFVDNAGKKTPKFYFCPADATVAELKTANEITERNNLLPLEELYADLANCTAATKLLIVDACRNDPTAPNIFRSSLASSTLPKLPPPTGGTATFFSCKANQQAVEDSGLQQGVFTHFLVKGLQGDADQPTAGKPGDGIITFAELSTYVANNTYAHVYDKFKVRQSPELRGDYDLNLPLVRINRQIPQEITNSIGMTLKLIPAGEFLMGSSDADVAAALKADSNITAENLKGERPQHRVKISRPFYAGVYEVTQGEYEAVMGTNPSHFSTSGGGGDKVGGMNTKRFPVETVSWYDAIEFCNKLSQKEKLTPYYSLTSVEREDGHIKSATVVVGQASSLPTSGYRLPTEAEWEYLCRSATTSAYNFGSVLNGDKANVDGNYPFGTTTKGSFLERSTDVGSYAVNRFGLHDVHGNVWEWCFDVYDESSYGSRSGTTADPLSSSGSEYRVLRGGSWYSLSGVARSAGRAGIQPVDRDGSDGFRLVR